MSPPDPRRAEVAHLLRRAGFGASGPEVDAGVAAGYDATVERLLRPPADPGVGRTPVPTLPALPPPPTREDGRTPDRDAKRAYNQQRRAQLLTVTQWWLNRMAAVQAPFVEKRTLFWHGHFATSAQKVRWANLMLAQNEAFRRLGGGDFRELARTMVRDPAMLLWLDGRKNTRRAPNENLARELMELFTIGHGTYTESDVQEAARALTGWTVAAARGTAALDRKRHDPGAKTVLGTTAAFDDRSLVDLLVSRPESPRFLATRVWQRFAHPEPPPADVLARLVAAYGSGRDLTALFRALFLDPAFRAPRARNALVKHPVEWAVGAHRALAVPLGRTAAPSADAPGRPSGAPRRARPSGAPDRTPPSRPDHVSPSRPDRTSPGGPDRTPSSGAPDGTPASGAPDRKRRPRREEQTGILATLRAQGQVPFYPPSVGGWPTGGAWLSTAASHARLDYAQRLARVADLAALGRTAAAARPAALAALLGVDGFTPRTAAVLADAAGDLPTLVALALVSPEYLVA